MTSGPRGPTEGQQPTFYVTVEVRVIADTEDEAKARLTERLAAQQCILGFIIGDTERGGLI